MFARLLFHRNEKSDNSTRNAEIGRGLRAHIPAGRFMFEVMPVVLRYTHRRARGKGFRLRNPETGAVRSPTAPPRGTPLQLPLQFERIALRGFGGAFFL